MASLQDGLNQDDFIDLNGSSNITSILDMLGFDLVRDNILKQIHNETSSTIDYLMGALADNFKSVINADFIDSDDKVDVKTRMTEFCEDLISEISDEFNVMINHISDDYQSMFDLADVLYHFLVLNRREVVERFLIYYIEQNKFSLMDSIEVDDKVKDVSSLSYRKKNFSKEDTFILAHIPDIIEFIYNGNIVESEEFLDTINDGEYYTVKMLELFQDGTACGNFVPHLMYTVLGDDYDCSEAINIRNSIRVYFYRKSTTDNESEE